MIDQTISHYKILEKLGEGGMGIVYKAEDTKLKRTVALKFLPPELTRDPEAKERFIQEAQAASALDHPNICNIHEIDETENGQMFIVMACYEGETLREKIKRGPLKLELAIEIAIQVAKGLVKAHEKGIIHLDIKPANIFVSKDGLVKIIDFGMAKLKDDLQILQDGTTMGTIAYMSPEQTYGAPLDHRTDIWAVGVVLYEMVTGELPFKGHYEQALVYSIVNEDPVPIAELRSETPSELIKAIEKALQKNPETRYQDIASMLSDLMKISGYKDIKISEQSIPLIAVLPFADMSPQKDQDYFCDGMTEELIVSLSEVREWQVVSRTSVFTFKNKDQDIRTIGKQLNVSHAIEGSVRKAGSHLRITVKLINIDDGFQLWSEKYDRELDDVFAIQDDIARSIVEKLKIKLDADQEVPLFKRHTENVEAYNLYLKARYYWNKRTEEGLMKGIAYCEQSIGIEPKYARAYAGMADCFIILGFQGISPPEQVMPKAKSAVEKALEIDERLSEAHTSLGCIKAVYEWNWIESEQEFKRAIELNPNNSNCYHWYAIWCLLPTKRFDECLIALQKAQELDPLSLVLNAGIGWQFYYARRFDMAIEKLKETIYMDESFIMAHDILGQVYELMGKPEDAIAELEKAVLLSGRRTLSLCALAHAYALFGHRDQAQSLLDELIALQQHKYISSYEIAIVYSGLNKNDQSFQWLEKAYEERNGWLCFLNVEPRFDNLRSDPRFTALLNKVGLL